MANWSKLSSSGNVEDRRGGPLMLGGGLGVIGTLLWLAFSYFSGNADPAVILDELNQVQQIQQNYSQTDFQTDEYPKFAAAVLGSSNDLWRKVFAESGRTYTEPKLVLFRSATQSGCGMATSQVGPHYCPTDSTIYLDETFFDELEARFKAKGGDVAEAYVIAHEVGHHVQNQLDIGIGQQQSNEDSVKAELQADCFAGVWANSVNSLGVFEPGEVAEAIDAAAAVGDDRIQQTIEGRVTPENWTHGSSEQRVGWFNRGYESGNPGACNTFD